MAVTEKVVGTVAYVTDCLGQFNTEAEHLFDDLRGAVSSISPFKRDDNIHSVLRSVEVNNLNAGTLVSNAFSMYNNQGQQTTTPNYASSGYLNGNLSDLVKRSNGSGNFRKMVSNPSLNGALHLEQASGNVSLALFVAGKNPECKANLATLNSQINNLIGGDSFVLLDYISNTADTSNSPYGSVNETKNETAIRLLLATDNGIELLEKRIKKDPNFSKDVANAIENVINTQGLDIITRPDIFNGMLEDLRRSDTLRSALLNSGTSEGVRAALLLNRDETVIQAKNLALHNLSGDLSPFISLKNLLTKEDISSQFNTLGTSKLLIVMQELKSMYTRDTEIPSRLISVADIESITKNVLTKSPAGTRVANINNLLKLADVCQGLNIVQTATNENGQPVNTNQGSISNILLQNLVNQYCSKPIFDKTSAELHNVLTERTVTAGLLKIAPKIRSIKGGDEITTSQSGKDLLSSYLASPDGINYLKSMVRSGASNSAVLSLITHVAKTTGQIDAELLSLGMSFLKGEATSAVFKDFNKVISSNNIRITGTSSEIEELKNKAIANLGTRDKITATLIAVTLNSSAMSDGRIDNSFGNEIASELLRGALSSGVGNAVFETFYNGYKFNKARELINSQWNDLQQDPDLRLSSKLNRTTKATIIKAFGIAQSVDSQTLVSANLLPDLIQMLPTEGRFFKNDKIYHKIGDELQQSFLSKSGRDSNLSIYLHQESDLVELQNKLTKLLQVSKSSSAVTAIISTANWNVVGALSEVSRQAYVNAIGTAVYKSLFNANDKAFEAVLNYLDSVNKLPESPLGKWMVSDEAKRVILNIAQYCVKEEAKNNVSNQYFKRTRRIYAFCHGIGKAYPSSKIYHAPSDLLVFARMPKDGDSKLIVNMTNEQIKRIRANDCFVSPYSALLGDKSVIPEDILLRATKRRISEYQAEIAAYDLETNTWGGMSLNSKLGLDMYLKNVTRHAWFEPYHREFSRELGVYIVGEALSAFDTLHKTAEALHHRKHKSGVKLFFDGLIPIVKNYHMLTEEWAADDYHKAYHAAMHELSKWQPVMDAYFSTTHLKIGEVIPEVIEAMKTNVASLQEKDEEKMSKYLTETVIPHLEKCYAKTDPYDIANDALLWLNYVLGDGTSYIRNSNVKAHLVNGAYVGDMTGNIDQYEVLAEIPLSNFYVGGFGVEGINDDANGINGIFHFSLPMLRSSVVSATGLRVVFTDNNGEIFTYPTSLYNLAASRAR
jgi:hypothetical protein